MAQRCRHEPCTCDVQTGDYCSPICAEMAKPGHEPQTPNCECDHPTCQHSGHS